MELTLLDLFVNVCLGVLIWYLIHRVFTAVESLTANDGSEEFTPVEPDQLILQVDLENNKGLWYGWLIVDEKEQFIAQSDTKEKAIQECVEVLKKKYSSENLRIQFYETTSEEVQRDSRSDTQE